MIKCPHFAVPTECGLGVRCLKQGRCLLPIGDGQSDDRDQADTETIGPE